MVGEVSDGGDGVVANVAEPSFGLNDWRESCCQMSFVKCLRNAMGNQNWKRGGKYVHGSGTKNWAPETEEELVFIRLFRVGFQSCSQTIFLDV